MKNQTVKPQNGNGKRYETPAGRENRNTSGVGNAPIPPNGWQGQENPAVVAIIDSYATDVHPERVKGHRSQVRRLALYVAGHLALKWCLSDDDMASDRNNAANEIEEAILSALDEIDWTGIAQLSRGK